MAPEVVLLRAVSGNLEGVAEIISQSDRRALEVAVSALKAGELVVYPTDTVYGLGAAAGNEDAVRRLFAAKGRSPSKAVPLLVADALMATWVAEVTPVAHNLMSALWPGALTIVMRRLDSYQSVALADGDTVALREPGHEFALGMIAAVGEPVVGTSANRSAGRAAVSAAEAAFQFGDMVALAVDGGRMTGVESTVIDITRESGPMIVREGAVTQEEIERVLGRTLGTDKERKEAGE
ncbi:MAG: threonylcarbamoyl-AMP synthase [Chloroflexi bacterium]|nr:threonylcarbamoyl-AMP synthase [Chloroflexota bacterium]